MFVVSFTNSAVLPNSIVVARPYYSMLAKRYFVSLTWLGFWPAKSEIVVSREVRTVFVDCVVQAADHFAACSTKLN